MKLGFIGAGNLGGSVVIGLANSGKIDNNNLFIFEPNNTRARELKENLDINIAIDTNEIFNKCDLVFIAVKPYIMTDVLTNLKDIIKETPIISLAAGFTLDMMENICPQAKFIRALTNTPSSLNAATTTLTKGKNTDDTTFKKTIELFSYIGSTCVIEEKYMDLSTALAGSGPAFFYAVSNAFANGCKKLGLDEKTSLIMSAQTMMGAAKMLLQSGKNPETLIREVTTPNGCTAEGLNFMERNKVDQILSETIEITTNKATKLAQK